MWQSGEFRLRLREGSVLEHEKVMLSSGQCDCFMPMGFIGDEKGVTACYDCSGFAPLSSYRIERTEDALYLLERTLIILGNAVQYLISPERVMLTTSTVFYNKDTGQVRIAYVPMAEQQPDMRRNIAAFAGQLKSDIADGRGALLDEVSRCALYKNYHVKDLITKVAVLKRRIYAGEAGSKSVRDESGYQRR